jgi:hypothetical protein
VTIHLKSTMDYEQTVKEMNEAVLAYDSLMMEHSDLLLQLEEAEHRLQQAELQLEYGNATEADVNLAIEKCVKAEHAFGSVMQKAITAMNTARHNMYTAYELKKLK